MEEYNYFEHVGLVNESLKAFLNKKDMAVVRDYMELFNQESTEDGILKMILILTKSFKDNPLIKDVREDLKKIIEKKRGYKLI